MIKDNKVVQFTKDEMWLSNMIKCDVILDGVTYCSVENAFQAAKCLKPTARKQFEDLDGYQAKKLGKTVDLRSDWEENKLIILLDLVRQKFNQPKFKTLLLETKNMYIQEGNLWNDRFYGVCLKTGIGANYLGLMLMQVRKELQEVEYLDKILKATGDRVFSVRDREADSDNIYVGRPSILGNPYATSKTLQSRIDNCMKFRTHLQKIIKEGKNLVYIQAVKDLKGKNVICYCSNGTTSVSEGARYCHSHILLSASDMLNKE